MTSKLAAVADVFDALADHLDELDAGQTQKKTAESRDLLETYASQYEQNHGEALPVSTRAKLASLDLEVLQHLVKSASNVGGTPDSLGGPADSDATKVASNRNAEEAFLDFINS